MRWSCGAVCPPFLGRPLRTACDEHPSGYYGFSVQAAVGLTVEQLASECRNNVVGYMTAGEIRTMGYEVRETSGEGRHATVVVPRPLGTQASPKKLADVVPSRQEPVTQEAAMKTISADFNAMTEAGHVRLTLPCSQEDILRLGLGPGDWAWLSDTEVVVGAQLAIDDRYGLVGVPDWDTLVHLDDEGADDFDRIKAALSPLLDQRSLPQARTSREFLSC